MEATERLVRLYVFNYFLEHTYAPAAEETARFLNLSLSRAKEALKRLEEGHHLKLLDGTSRILMAFPFSAVSTPFRVTRLSGKQYFANCAWDAIAFHPMLNEPIGVESFCDRCGEPVRFRVERGKGVPEGKRLPVVQLALPATEWWKDITRTCSNTMVFLGPEEVGPESSGKGGPSESGIVTVDQVVQMSLPIYSGKLSLEYERPAPSVIQANFRRIGLTGPHWALQEGH